MNRSQQIRLVIADDHQMFREGVRGLLEKHEDFRVLGEGSTGYEAVELAERLQPDVVLLDISMPGMGGLESCCEIFLRSPETKVLFLTVHPEDRFAIRVLKAGANGYLTKDSAAEQLVSAVRRVANGERVVSKELAAQMLREDVERRDVESVLLSLLTAEEKVMIELMSTGRVTLELASEMGLSVRKVQETRKEIVRKFGLSNREELTRYALRFRLA